MHEQSQDMVSIRRRTGCGSCLHRRCGRCLRPCAGSEKCTEGVPRRDGNADADRVLSVGDRLTNPEQGFSVELPVNRDAITATMKKENGVWKLDSIDSQISLSAAVPADDEVCRKRYPTFETARQAADSIDDQAYIKEARFA